jgi:hypothetical protein
MFPLGTVLVPYAVLPLHVFEPRYRVLVYDCLRADREFGVVLIERGSEVGGADQRFGVATVARIADAEELPDGRWVLLTVGTRRVDVVGWLADDPYPVALTEARGEPAWSDGAEAALGVADRAVRAILTMAAELGDGGVSPSVELSPDGAVAAWQLLAVAPIGSLDKQRLLGVDDPAERLGLMAEMADDVAILLADRRQRE